MSRLVGVPQSSMYTSNPCASRLRTQLFSGWMSRMWNRFMSAYDIRSGVLCCLSVSGR